MSEVQDRPTESTALVAVKASLPTILAIDGTRDILSALLDELSGYVPDGSTEEGRSEATSKAYKVSRAKNDIIRLADKQKEGAQAIIKGVNAEIKIVETRMDAERDRIKKVVEDYKAIEATRVAAHQSALQQILDWPRAIAAAATAAEHRQPGSTRSTTVRAAAARSGPSSVIAPSRPPRLRSNSCAGSIPPP